MTIQETFKKQQMVEWLKAEQDAKKHHERNEVLRVLAQQSPRVQTLVQQQSDYALALDLLDPMLPCFLLDKKHRELIQRGAWYLIARLQELIQFADERGYRLEG